MGIWEAIKAVFNTAFKNPVLFLPMIGLMALAAVFFGAVLLVSGASLGQFASALSSSSPFMGILQSIGGALSAVLIAVVGVIVCVLLFPLIMGIYLSAATQSSERVDIGAAYAKAKSKWASLLGVLVINAAIGGVASTILGLIPLLGTFLSFVAGIIIDVLLFLATALVIVENRSAVDAVQNSIALGRQNFWNILFLVIIFGVIIGVIALVLVLLGAVVSLAAVGATYASALGIAAAIILVFIIETPLAGMLPVAFYYEYKLGGRTPAAQPQIQQAPVQAPPSPPPVAPAPKKATAKRGAKKAKKAAKTS